MAGIDRRILLGGAALASAVTMTPVRATPMLQLSDLKKEADVACLYHCDFGDPPRFVQMLTNISNHFSAYGADPFAVQIVIVAHGAGVKFFLESLEGTSWRDEAMVPQIFDRVLAQAKNGLKAHLCDITFQRLNIDRSKVRKADFITFVPSGVATVAALQGKGYAYLKIG
ncbi:DsrE family protein [Phreatobacter sp.]|uniref:DsrE family protein n=1 Tax=Phreatobacter sp. TaxID=1966341 RepID=UPI0025EC798D|nr:DsrE family protein [Phreatobacter sp.]